jgi:NAD(P)-dependent dehydrogenase (short-subunit alcohol dehydrogenase family)
MSDAPSPNRRTLLAGAAVAATTACAAAQPQSAPNLSGKTILITGCSSGFGRLGAEYYARCGARVFASMRNLPRPEAEDLRALAAKEKLSIDVIEIDVTSDQSVARGIGEAPAKTNGKIDVLVNNAGIGVSGPVELQDMRATRLAFETNVYGCHRVALGVLAAMRKAGGGQIFAVSSQLGRLIVPGIGHYSATKFALEAMSEQLAYEVKPLGIDVTIIQPGAYPTKVWVNRNLYTAEVKARASAEQIAAYGALASDMGKEDGAGRTADPLDVPRAIADIIAMPKGARPLRRAVHPNFRPQEGVNAAMAEAQLAFLGERLMGRW